MNDELDIVYKHMGETRSAFLRCVVKHRSAIKAVLNDLILEIPRKHIVGPAFCVFWFVTSVREGYDVEIGVPVDESFTSGEVEIKVFPANDTLSRVHRGGPDELRDSLLGLYRFATKHAIISDEYRMEIFIDGDDPEGSEVELLFIVHNWNRLLEKNLIRVLGDSAQHFVMQGAEEISIKTTVNERFEWVKAAMSRLDGLASEDQKYDILSSCAHVFPKSQIDKLRAIYLAAIDTDMDNLQAVDAVMDFMAQDPGWGERPRREGRIIYASKNPRDPEGFNNAKSMLEKRQAYCFCPLVRENLDRGMSLYFCYCGSGWYRQQWEGTVGKPVRIEIVESVLKGDAACTFAIHLPDDL